MLLKKDTKMGSKIDEMLTTAASGAMEGLASGLAGGLGSQIGYALGDLTGYNKKLRQDQLNQQQALTDMQYNANLGLMKESYANQLKMWHDTNYAAQIDELKKAGLNPALMYAKGGQGGSTGGGGASVSGGTAANTAAMQSSNNQQAAMGLSLMKMQSEIELNKSIAAKNTAEATITSGAQTKLTGAQTELVNAQTTEINSKIDNLKADTALKAEQSQLIKLQENSAQIANEFNSANNKTLLSTNLQILREITAKSNVAEQTQNQLIELAKLNIKQSISQTLLNNSNIKLNENDINLINAKIQEITNTITITNKQLLLNQDALDQAMHIEKMNMSSGMITKELRGLGLAIRNAFTGRNDYDY